MNSGRWIVLLTVLVAVLGELKDVDWRGQGLLTTVGDQANCNGCVAFTLVGALEFYTAKLTENLIPLSVQYLIDCGIDEYTGLEQDGCSGGTLRVEVDEIMSTQYVPYAADYTYKSNFMSGRCDQYHAREKLLRNALADVWVYTYTPLSQTQEALRQALQNGPAIVNFLISSEAQQWQDTLIHEDKTCVAHAVPHSMVFVGWQENNGNPYYIARNSYGEEYGEHGYIKYADSEVNLPCKFTSDAYTISVGRRRELEYKLGEGLKSFGGAREWCQAQGDGWDLAHIPTQMHNLEVYDLFTEAFGDDKKGDNKFNYYWIGLARPETDWVWVDSDNDPFADRFGITGTVAQYLRFKHEEENPRFVAVDKVNHGEHKARGTWSNMGRGETLRFVCSRYRNEACPRISQTAVDNAFSVTFYEGESEDPTLEINEGTKAKVCCMAGFKPSGKTPGECKNGKWVKLPKCKANKKKNVDGLSDIEVVENTLDQCSDSF